jgi:V8-like Glu-specific endopeptidase
MKLAVLLGCIVATVSSSAFAQISLRNGVVSYIIQNPDRASSVRLDYANAKPLPRPQAIAPTANVPQASVPSVGAPRFFPGTTGNGRQTPIQLLPGKTDKDPLPSADGLQEYGSQGIPYSTSRLNAYDQPTATYRPFAAAGKLFFKIGSGSYVCSASLIKPGIIVTAAHCVANFGQSQLYSDWQFVPGYNNGTAPYGIWTATSVHVLASYYNGTDACSQSGVVCTNDVATINLYTPNGFPGTQAGTFGYAVDGYGYTAAGLTLVNQLGYPVALDSGVFMQRTDSQGSKGSLFGYPDYVTIIGSLQTGGSSGGPWLINLGRTPLLNGTGFGTDSTHNVVIGVTSFGNDSAKRQGASRFTSANIGALLTESCTVNPGKC